MDIEELLREADFSKHSAAHKAALWERLFGKPWEGEQARKSGQTCKSGQAREEAPARKKWQTRESGRARELTLDDLEQVTAAGKTWIEPEKKFPSE